MSVGSLCIAMRSEYVVCGYGEVSVKQCVASVCRLLDIRTPFNFAKNRSRSHQLFKLKLNLVRKWSQRGHLHITKFKQLAPHKLGLM